jgi:hypothetical protein
MLISVVRSDLDVGFMASGSLVTPQDGEKGGMDDRTQGTQGRRIGRLVRRSIGALGED